MPTIITHSFVGWIASRFLNKPLLPRILILSLILPVLPDLDVISFQFGIPYEHFWGHRGFTHSLAFAALLGVLGYGAVSVLKEIQKVRFAPVEQAVVAEGQQAQDERQQAEADHPQGHVQPEQGSHEARRDDRHRGGGDEGAAHHHDHERRQGPAPLPRVALQQALPRGRGVAMGMLEERVLAQEHQQHGPQQPEAVVGARPRALHQVRDADAGAGEEDPGPEGLQAGPPASAAAHAPGSAVRPETNRARIPSSSSMARPLAISMMAKVMSATAAVFPSEARVTSCRITARRPS